VLPETERIGRPVDASDISLEEPSADLEPNHPAAREYGSRLSDHLIGRAEVGEAGVD